MGLIIVKEIYIYIYDPVNCPFDIQRIIYSRQKKTNMLALDGNDFSLEGKCNKECV